jgi:hypothetical protein
MNPPLTVFPPEVQATMVEHKQHGRKKPYTAEGIKRLPCFRCGRPATQQWSICADGNLHHPVCVECDIILNKLVLWFMRVPDWSAKLDKYIGEMK